MLEGLSRKLGDIVREVGGKSHISERNVRDAIEEIKNALLEADVNLRVVRRFVNATVRDAVGEAVLRSVAPGQRFVKLLYDRLVALLGDERSDLQLRSGHVSPLLLVGLQGAGKTTAAAKIAWFLMRQGHRPMLVAADLARPAAADQLETLGQGIGVAVIRAVDGESVLDVARRGMQTAARDGADVVIVDTAGRLQVDEKLMAEVVHLRRELDPAEVLLVADSMTGQTAAEVAKAFDEQVGLTGVVLTKLDSDTRGGAALSIKGVTGKPIKLVGTGEKVEDLEPFHPDRIASRILGMGDVVSLVEQAQETISEEDATDLVRKLQRSTFSLEDYLEQLRRMKKMGSLTSMLEKVPGMQAALDSGKVNEKDLGREEAMMLSMTLGERRNPRILGPARRRRVARGSGTSVSDVNRLLKKFTQMTVAMKKMATNKKYQEQMMAQFGGR